MRDDLAKDADFAERGPIDPVAMARRDLKKSLPRRFWSDVSVAVCENGFGIELDGRPVRTPAKAPLVVPTRALAEVLADEWRAQGATVEPDTMPTTRLVNSALDGVARAIDPTIAEVAKFAETDLVCYRAGEPETLVTAQAEAWDPVLRFAREILGARFVCSEGIIYVAQPENALAAVRAAVETIALEPPAGVLRLAALSVMTSLTGSVLIALAVAHGAMAPDQAWAAANVDEDHQLATWGADGEASTRRARRWLDMNAAAKVYLLSA